MKKVYVGEYSEAELKEGKDKQDVAEAQAKTGLQYVVTQMTKKLTMKIWVSDDFEL